MLKTNDLNWRLSCLIAILAVGCCVDAYAQTKRCDELPLVLQKTKQEILTRLHPYEGCDQTFARCLMKKPVHPLVLRLTNDICRLIKAGRSAQDIERAIARRAQTMLPQAKSASITVDPNMRAGDPKAPVQVVVYACSRCPFCKVVVPGLYKEVTEKSLKGKVQLFFRPFPLRNHPGSIEGGLAMISAARLGRFWPVLIRMYERYDQFCPKLLPDWAAETGLDKSAFEKEMATPKNRESLVASKQEGIRNKVEATPTLFINGQKYLYEMQMEAILDVLQEAYEMMSPARKTP